MTGTLTLAHLRAVAERLREYRVRPGTVETEEQAQTMTLEDPFGFVWAVGDQYYLVPPAPSWLGGHS